ncbi:MAG TPA: shikimate kinase [Verrucomicrobiae bacterium]|jgi:shikimate kinase
MSATRPILNLALTGFMGTGKSSIGRMAAEHLRFTFIDTDELIENETGQSVADIFARQGEAAFRKYERDVVEALRTRRDTVIATGGGLAADLSNLASLKSHALVVCLWASPETIWERVRTQSHRPLLQAPDPLGRIREMLEQRGPAYRQADVLVHTGLRSTKEATQQILHQFLLTRQGR